MGLYMILLPLYALEVPESDMLGTFAPCVAIRGGR